MSSARVRRPSRDEVRQRLLDAAAEVLVSHGYGSATVEVITEAAGLSRGALYSNFADKDDLYLELLDRLEQQQLDELRAVFQEHLDLDRFLQTLASRHRSGTRDARSHLILQVELWLLAMRNEAVRERFAAIQRRAADAIARLVAGADVDLEPIEIAATVLALGDGLMMQQLLDPERLRPTIYVDVLRALATRTGLIPPDGAR